MTIQIGPTIARLRHEQGITQEQLAGAIGVSAPAVSKWETGQSYPDITLLPPLARYFGVTVDELIAYAPSLTNEACEAIATQAEGIFEQEGWEAGIAFCDAKAREYPREMYLRVMLASGLMQSLVFAPDEAQRQAGRERQIKWLQEATASPEAKTQLLAQNLLGIFYMNMKRLDEAEEIFERMLDMPASVENLMPTLRMLQGRHEEATKLAQLNLLSYANDAASALMTLSTLAIKQGHTDRATQYIDAADGLMRLLGLENMHRQNLTQSRMIIAHAAADPDALLAASEAYAASMLDWDLAIRGPLFDKVARDNEAYPSPAQDKALLLHVIENFEENESFDTIREKPRFKQMVDTLKRKCETEENDGM